LLFAQGRFVEADEVVRKLQEQRTPFTSELTRVASQVSLQLENFDRALSLAEEWAEKSNSQDDHIWLAQMYGITGQTELAEQEFRKAIAMAPEKPAAWVALVQMYGRAGDKEAGARTIAE